MLVAHKGAQRLKQLLFLILPEVHVLDLAGPVQVFYEANGFGGDYRLRYCGPQTRVRTAQGLWLSEIEPLPQAGAGDTVLVPGIDSEKLDRLEHVPVEWLRKAAAAGARLCSICSGAFILAHAGLLDGRECTTHWKVADRLAASYPAARVLGNRLFVKDGPLITSAGVASGIDMALSIVEQEHGPLVAGRVAREMVVYLRRDGSQTQASIFLSFRTHLNPGVHRVQDHLIAHPGEKPTIDQLARLAGMSRRSLTRAFRQATGITLKTFSNRLKLEIAGNLLHDSTLSIEAVASRCGFEDARQLRRLWKSKLGVSPSDWKGVKERRWAR
jgi:transcriptional regulator GlxA family with amidase domain